MLDHTFDILIFHREYDLDSSIQITRHPVSRAHVDFFFSAIQEVEDTAVLQISSYNRTNMDILTHTRKSGLAALTWNTGLEQAAAVRAVEASQSFSHTRPDGSEWWTVNSNLMYAENLAKGYTTGDSVVTAWMNSPTHKANLMDGELRSMALAVHINGNRDPKGNNRKVRLN